jgi:hypothetical protein
VRFGQAASGFLGFRFAVIQCCHKPATRCTRLGSATGSGRVEACAIMFMDRRHFYELLTKSEEGIASNILADRLQIFVERGIIAKSHDPTHKQKAINSLREKGIELLPLLMEMNAWGHKCLPASG